jgi:hypothetical protein
MSRTYSNKPEMRKKPNRSHREKRVVLADYEIEFIEMNLGPSIRLRM